MRLKKTARVKRFLTNRFADVDKGETAGTLSRFFNDKYQKKSYIPPILLRVTCPFLNLPVFTCLAEEQREYLDWQDSLSKIQSKKTLTNKRFHVIIIYTYYI